MTKLVDDLALAITNYLDNRDINLLKPYIGKLKTKEEKEPFGEPELGQAINKGDYTIVNTLLDKMTNFSDSPNTTRLLSIVNKLDKYSKGSGANNFIRIMKYIMSGKATSKVPTKLVKVIDNSDWTFLVYGCQSY